MKTLYPVTLSVAMLLSLVGCNNSTSTSTEATPEQTSKTEYVSPLPDTAPVVKVGTEANYTPFEFKNEYGQVVGFDIDIVRAIGENQGFKVKIHNDPWEEVFINLENGSRDMIAAGLSNNKERRSKYAVSNPYVNSETQIAYSEKLPDITSVDEFKNLTVSGMEGANGNKIFEENENIKVKTFPTLFLAMQAMLQGKVDAVIADSSVLHYSFNELGATPKYFVYQPKQTSSEEYQGIFFMVDKNQPELLTQLNKGLDELVANGTYAQLTKKWFGKDLTEELKQLQAEHQAKQQKLNETTQ